MESQMRTAAQERSDVAIAPCFSWMSPTQATDAVEAFTKVTGLDPAIEWQMQPGEQTALLALLAGLRPEVAIEIGSRYGGSMQVLAKYADRVISIDIDPTCHERLGAKFPNAEFVTGASRDVFQPLLTRLQQEEAEVGFILIDGDHTAAGVQADINGLLGYRPNCPLFVLLHDSFNPDVREGIRTAKWEDNPHVHAVELDFVGGLLTLDPDAYREMWGGFALAILLPKPREGRLTVTARLNHQFERLFGKSAHHPLDFKTVSNRVVRKCRKLIGLSTAN
jgi:cephalosporin hydroxylase